MDRLAMAAALVLLSSPALAPAQDAPLLDLGRRVRVTTDSGPSRVLIGTLVGQDSAALRVLVASRTRTGEWSATDSLVLTVARSRIRQLDVSIGRRSNAGKGAAIGLVFGAATGLAVGIAASNESGFLDVTAGDVAAMTLVTGLLGASLGGLIGLATTSDVWEPASAARAHVTLAPRGPGLGLSFTF